MRRCGGCRRRRPRSPAHLGNAEAAAALAATGDRRAVETQIEAFALEAEPLRQPLLSWNVVTWRAMLALLDARLHVATTQLEPAQAQALGAGERARDLVAAAARTAQELGVARIAREAETPAVEVG